MSIQIFESISARIEVAKRSFYKVLEIGFQRQPNHFAQRCKVQVEPIFGLLVQDWLR